ncbi:flavodoxin family protein [Sporolactobacillus putidus]|uniref:NAD(P)H-dependent FMN-containing oxidoreductase YwqN n=1 Tax=Sporolactobacillus putidus TaxID=492735 RepID=A0A917S293_9BACL|nr:flavodoxin family protein [Sporolactobacillus putidus]GGL53708.1 putative NAD(P)H-dependent FMN-containing oxidoreductase YwqN [Sporolactobacillus putidus]
MKIIAFYGSIRDKGNSEQLADIALQDLDVTKIFLKDYHIDPISDLNRLTKKDPSNSENDDYRALIQKQILADLLLFVTPVYWYGMSSLLKLYIDRWSEALRDPSIPGFREKMKEKEVHLITVGGDEPYVKALPMIQQTQFICDFLQMKFGSYIIGKGDKKGEVLTDKNALHSAVNLNHYLKARSSL